MTHSLGIFLAAFISFGTVYTLLAETLLSWDRKETVINTFVSAAIFGLGMALTLT